MDPNIALARIRELLADNDHLQDNEMLADLIDYVTGLDAWLSHGGFLPDAWNQTKGAVK